MTKKIKYEVWQDNVWIATFSTLEEARACVRRMSTKDKPLRVQQSD